MTNPLITLACPSCGGKLQIVKGVDRFACGYCGNEQVVHRESGIVYLEPIAEDIHHIRAGVENIRGGVDKTAAELAIARLTKELSDLESELQSATTRKFSEWKPNPNLEITLFVACVCFFLIARNMNIPVLWFLFLCLLGFSLYLSAKRNGTARQLRDKTIQNLRTGISDTKGALIKNKRLV